MCDTNFFSEDSIQERAALLEIKNSLKARNYASIYSITRVKESGDAQFCDFFEKTLNYQDIINQFFRADTSKLREFDLCDQSYLSYFDALIDEIDSYRSRIIIGRKLPEKPVIEVVVNEETYQQNIHFTFNRENQELKFIEPSAQNLPNQEKLRLPIKGELVEVFYLSRSLQDLSAEGGINE